MRRPGIALLALLGASVAPLPAVAQAWTRDQGQGYVNVSYTFLSADRVYGPDFIARDIRRYRQNILGFYGEIGVVDRWLTAVVNAEIFRRSELADQGSTRGFGDMRVGLWSGLVTDPLRLSLGVTVGLPTGDPEPDAGAGGDAESQAIAASLPTGDGEWDFEPRVSAGVSFGGGEEWPIAHYAIAEIGYAVRTEGFSDAFAYKLEVGSRIPSEVLDRFTLVLRFFGTESFASQEEAASGFGGLGNGLTYTSLGAALIARIYANVGAMIGIETALRARSIVAAPPIRVALSYEF